MSAYLDTRVSLFANQLWQPTDFDALLTTSEVEMQHILQTHGLPQLASYASLDSRSLEQRSIAKVLDETRVLLRPLTDAARDFLLYWTGRFEINNVKTLLRAKMIGESPAELLSKLTPMGYFGRLDNEALAHAEDVMELLRRLEAGPFADIVRPARRAFEQNQDPFNLDASLDRAYYEGLAQRGKNLEPIAGAGFKTLMGYLIDRVNLVWLLRYRFNYKLPPAQVYYLLATSHYSLTSARLRELARLESLEDVLAALPKPWRARFEATSHRETGSETTRKTTNEYSASRADEASSIPGVFAIMERVTSQYARSVLSSRAPAISRAFAYLVLRERDLRAVRTVLRGRHLGLPSDDIWLALKRTSHAVM
jgi:V/A-type H+-transporting ATPase subunit C